MKNEWGLVRIAVEPIPHACNGGDQDRVFRLFFDFFLRRWIWTSKAREWE